MLRQAVLNIAGNAVEAMENGGDLTIHIESGDESCAIVVADTGPGIPPRSAGEDLSALLHDPAARDRYWSGHGVPRGAAAWREIIEVVSEPGQGTEFRVCLPLAGSMETA